MTLKTQTEIDGAKVGDDWQRNRYEVRYRVKGRAGDKWRVFARSATTIQEARNQITESKRENPTLVQMIGRGPAMEYQVVHVTGTCTVVE